MLVLYVIQNKLLKYSITAKLLIFTFNSVNVCFIYLWCFPGGSDGKKSSCNAGDQTLIPGLGRRCGERKDNPVQYSVLENPLDRIAGLYIVHGVSQSDTTE